MYDIHSISRKLAIAKLYIYGDKYLCVRRHFFQLVKYVALSVSIASVADIVLRLILFFLSSGATAASLSPTSKMLMM